MSTVQHRGTPRAKSSGMHANNTSYWNCGTEIPNGEHYLQLLAF